MTAGAYAGGLVPDGDEVADAEADGLVDEPPGGEQLAAAPPRGAPGSARAEASSAADSDSVTACTSIRSSPASAEQQRPMLRGEKSWTCSMSKIGERCLRTRAVKRAAVVTRDQHRTPRRERTHRVPADLERVEHVLDRLHAADERERLIGEDAGAERLGADRVPDAQRRRGQRRLGRLEADRLLEPRVA